MANLLAYKDLGIETESSFGASTAGTATRLHVASVGIELNPNKELVEDTSGTPKGRDRIVARRNDIEGDITGFGTPRSLHHMFELALGEAGSSVALGTAAIITYNQNTSGSMISKTINVDRNNSQEKFSGVRGKSLELTASDDLLEFTTSVLAQARANGVALPDNVVGETVLPFTFSDITATIHQGATYGAEGVELKLNEWNLTYDNGLEGTHQSGSKAISRSDPSIPTVEGSMTIFHEGASWVDATYGCSEFYVRFEATLPSCAGLIDGVTPYLLRIDTPRVQLSTNTRNYEQAALQVEEIKFMGMFDNSAAGTSALIVPSLTVGTEF